MCNIGRGEAMPFTPQEFFETFARYNAAIWPLQIIAYLAGAAVLALLFRPGRGATLAVALILAAMWALNGLGYHWLHFARINPAALVFGAVFVAQALLLAAAPWLFGELRFALTRDLRSALGLGLIGFAAVLYPLWGALAGHAWPAVPAFGVAPCPTTIFTIGVLLTGPWRAVRWLLAIPVLWALVGGSAAVLLAVPQDMGLIAAALIVAAVALGRRLGLGAARHAVP